MQITGRFVILEGFALRLLSFPSYPLLAGRIMVLLASNGWTRMDEVGRRVKLFWLGASSGGMLIEPLRILRVLERRGSPGFGLQEVSGSGRLKQGWDRV